MRCYRKMLRVSCKDHVTNEEVRARIQGEDDTADRRRGGKTILGMDRPGGCQVTESSGEQGGMEETGCKIICSAPVTLMVEV